MPISDTITIDAGPGIDAVNEFAAAMGEAAAKFADSVGKINADMAKIGASGGAGAGPDRLIAQWEAAGSKLGSIASDINAKLADIGKVGAAGAAGPDKLVASWDKAAADISGSVDKIMADAGKLDDSAAASAVGAPGKIAEAWNAAATDIEASAARIAEAQKAVADSQNTVTASAAKSDAAIAGSAAAQSKAAKQAAADAEASSKKHSALLLGIAGAAAYGIYEAGNLQQQVTRLYTSAGESRANLPMIQKGILAMAGPTATDQSQLAQGAYMVESAGFHGQSALDVLKATAQGAYAEGAPLGETANALTSLLNAYGLRKGVPVANQATSAMNQIMAMVGSGKMTMAGAVQALPILAPVAAQAGLSFGEVGGALATMTQTGASPDWAAQTIRHTITKLQGPSNVQSAELSALGINPVEMSKNLGKTGLTGTIAEIDAAIQKHTNKKTGLVDLPLLNQSKLMDQSALQQISAMPPAIQKIADAYLNNTITSKQLRQEEQQLAPLQANLLKQFAGTADKAHGFNDLLKAAGGSAQTTAAALKAATGDSVGLQAALALGGSHLQVFEQNARAVSAAAKDAGTNIRGWEDIQKTFNYQLKSFETGSKAAVTSVGAALLPMGTDVMSGLAKAGTFLSQHPELTKLLGIGGGAIGASYALTKVASPVMTGLQSIGKVAQVLHIPGLDKLANVGQNTGLNAAASSLDGSAGALKGAAADLSGAAGRLAEANGLPGGHGEPGHDAAGRGKPTPSEAEQAARDAEKAAPKAESLFSKLGTGLKSLTELATGPVGWGVGITDFLVKPFLQSQKSGPNGMNWWENPFGQSRATSWIGSFAPYENLARKMDPVTSWSGLLHDINPFGGGGGPSPLSSAVSQHLAAPAQPSPGAQPGVGAALHGWHMPPVKAKVDVDLSSVNAAKEKAMSAMSGINQALKSAKPAKVPAPDMSALDAAKGKASSAANGIHDAMQNPLIHPVKASAPNLTAFQAAKGAAQADGVAISQGLAAGIQAGAGAAIAAAQSVASQVASVMASALQTHSPSRVTEAIGEFAGEGLAAGLHKSHAKVKKAAHAAAMTIAAATVTSLTQGLQGGQSAIDAAMTAILGKDARPQDIQQIDATVSTLIGDLDTALHKKIIGKSEDSSLVKWLKADNKKLDDLAQQRAKLETEISNAQQIGQAAVSEASITNAPNAQPTQSITPIASAQTVQGMQYQAEQQQDFLSQLGQLQKMGLNSQSLSQLLQGGATAGLPITQGLVSGGKGAIDQINQLEKSIMKSAQGLGNMGGPVMYTAGQQITTMMGSGLKSQLSKIDSEMGSIAKGMVAAVKSAIGGSGLKAAMQAAGQAAGQGFAQGIASEASAAAAAAKQLAQAAENAAKTQLKAHSPSRVFFDLGYGGIGGGLTGGMDAARPMVSLSAAQLAASTAAAYAQHPAIAAAPQWSRGSLGGGQAAVTHNWTVNVQGNVHTTEDLATSLQGVFLDRSLNNWRGGMAIPYKAV